MQETFQKAYEEGYKLGKLIEFEKIRTKLFHLTKNMHIDKKVQKTLDLCFIIANENKVDVPKFMFELIQEKDEETANLLVRAILMGIQDGSLQNKNSKK